MTMFWCSVFTVYIICMLWCVEFWCSKSGSVRGLLISWSVGISRPRLGRQRLWRQLSPISYYATICSWLTRFAYIHLPWCLLCPRWQIPPTFAVFKSSHLGDGLFVFAEICYRVLLSESRYTGIIQGQRVKGQGHSMT